MHALLLHITHIPHPSLEFHFSSKRKNFSPSCGGIYYCLLPSLIVVLFLQIKTQKKYVWGKRESTEEGRPLAEVVEQVRNSKRAWFVSPFIGISPCCVRRTNRS